MPSHYRLKSRKRPLAHVSKFFEHSAATVVSSHGKSQDERRPAVLYEIYNSDPVPSAQSIARLTQEAQTIIGAGTETTGNTLSMITFHLLANPTEGRRLKEELLSLEGDPIELLTYRELQKLPYLGAVISEGLRISSSVAGRLPRVQPSASIAYKSYTMPAGTAISMSLRDTHFDESIFADAHLFKPERWLGEDKRPLEKYLIPFSKGPRNCVGMNLALAELYVVLGNVFRKFDMELAGTKEADVSMSHDFFTPFGPTDSQGLRITIL